VIQPIPKDLLTVLVRSVIRVKAMKFKEVFNEFLQNTWVKIDYKKAIIQEKQALINLIYIQDGFKDCGSKPRE
jgi:hypothetical protein